MELSEIEVGMRVRPPREKVQKLMIGEATDPDNPVGTVMRVYRPGDRPPDKYDLLALIGWYDTFPVEVSWDGVDYTQPLYRWAGVQMYDCLALDEIEAA